MGKLSQVRHQLLKSKDSKVKKPSTKILLKEENNSKVNVIFRWLPDGTRSRTPFSTSVRVLCLGEGDCSFAYSLHCQGIAVIPTVFDSKDVFLKKYSTKYLDLLEEQGISVYFEVDGTKKIKPEIKDFNTVCWNFPHSGKGITDQEYNILSQQKLLHSFFTNFSSLDNYLKRKNKEALFNISLAPSDQTLLDSIPLVHNEEIDIRQHGLILMVTIWTGEPYDSWNIKKLASQSGWKCHVSFPFAPELYPDYQHVLTKGSHCQLPNHTKPSRTFVFVKS